MASNNSQDDSSSAPPWSYDVFLSFRGGDTRKNFTDHLYTALVQAGIHTFRDDDTLQRGKDISSQLPKAIQESRISIVVFSKNYASSTWCLDELVKILECQKKIGQVVLPIFYDVDPSDIRRQSGSFAKAFARHEERFKVEMEKVERWRVALAEAANLSGWDLQNVANGHESKFIKKIVEEVLCKVNHTYLSVAAHPVGIDSRVEVIKLLLSAGLDDVRIIGICGMGGIGKTVVAKAIYNQIFHNFESSSFLADVSEVSKQSNGLRHLQEQLLSETLMKKNLTVGNTDRGINLIKERLCCKRVLVVLDDLDHLDQLNSLAGNHDWFGPVSRIIITTREEHLLDVIKVDEKYKPKELNHDDSLQLFSWHAFKKTNPIEDYVELSNDIVDYVGGLPLALEVLGSYLFGRSMREWESAFEKLQRIPLCQIQRKLRISFDGLDDDELKNIFLDIACFFIGTKKDYAIRILNGCGFSSDIGISVLTSRSLVTINEYNELRMHDLLRDMGREIVREKFPLEPGKRSRLWFPDDVCAVLEKHKGTEAVEGLILSKKVHLSTEAFARMNELRLLQINYAHLTGNYELLSEELRWLCWHYCPLKLIPSNFHPENLVVLDLQYSNMRKVWKEIKFLIKLEVLNLSHSQHLIETPDFSGLPSLEILLLEDCIRLFEIHQSIGFLGKLVFLNLRDCRSLRNLPSSIYNLKSLESLNLSGCSKLKEFPEHLWGCNKQLPIKSLFSFLWSWLPPRNNLDSITVYPGVLSSLTMLDLRGNNFCSLPTSISHLSKLKTFQLDDCTNLQSLPQLPQSLQSLHAGGCQSLERISNLSNLKDLSTLFLNGCINLQSLPQLPQSLERLYADGCQSLERISNLSNLKDLSTLFLNDCINLQSLPQLPQSLQSLHADGCQSLERISNLSNLKDLSTLLLDRCTKLVEIQGLENSESIKSIHIERCNSLVKTFRKTFFKRKLESGRGCTTIVLPASGISNWFSHQRTGSSISFDMPSHPERKLRGLIVWAVFAMKEEHSVRRKYIPKSPYATISNKTKGVEWRHETDFTVPQTREDHAWVSYIAQEDFEYPMEVGDQVEVSFKGWEKSFGIEELEVKKCGIQLEYETDEKENNRAMIQCASPSSDEYADVDNQNGLMHNKHAKRGCDNDEVETINEQSHKDRCPKRLRMEPHHDNLDMEADH